MRIQTPRQTLMSGLFTFALATTGSLFALQPLPANALEAGSSTQSARTLSLDLPAGSLAGALNQLARQAGVTLSFEASIAKDKITAGLKGNYTLEEGFAALLTNSGLRARKTPEVYVISADSDGDVQTLPPVKVSATSIDTRATVPEAYAGGHVASGARLGMLGNTDIMQTPFSVTSYTEAAIQDQQARSILDVLIEEPSVRSASARTNINEDFTIRGFPVASQDVALNGMFGLMPYFRVPIEMAERVEVMKGPSALLNGMPPSGNVGGAINIVPKRAGAEPLTRVTAEYLSDSIYGGHLDVGRRFGSEDELGVRLNAVSRSGDSTVDFQSTREKVFSLGLDYDKDPLRLSADILHQNQVIDGVVRQFSLDPAIIDIPSPPGGETSYPGRWGDLDMEDFSAVARMEFDVTDAVTVYAGSGKRHSSMDSLTGNPLLSNESGDYLYAPAWQIFNVESTSSEAGALGNFATGSVTHEWTLGYTRVEQNADIFFYTGFPFQGANLCQPVTLTHVSREGIEPNLNRYNETLLTSYAFADTLSFMDERVQLTLGARRQQVEVQNFNFVTGQPSGAGYDEDATTPVAGIVIRPWENVSLYASYIEGLSQGPSAPNDPTLTNPGEVFPPLESKQKEIGIKIDWGTLYGSVALYEFDNPSGVRVGNTFSVNGEQRHRGLELTLFGEPLPSVRLNAGLAWMDSELSNTSNPATEGKEGIGVPELQANLRGEWDTPFLTGLTLHARVVYTREQYVNQANTQEVDDWVRTDVGARYRLTAGGRPVVLRATIENLFDESYWGVATAGYLHLGEARTLLVSATVDF